MLFNTFITIIIRIILQRSIGMAGQDNRFRQDTVSVGWFE